MIRSDLHTHTLHSHGQDSVAAMYQAGCDAGLAFLGFTEHSPRPEGYNYPQEYRERLQRGLPIYVEEVRALRHATNPVALFGMEVDWFEAEAAFVQRAVTAWPFDYCIGSVHFLGTWGYDATSKDWADLPEATRHAHYAAYFQQVAVMARSGWFQIAGHLDLIKIFSVASFRDWLRGDHLDLVRDALVAVRDAGMGMEVSSAGLRKPCAEIYPGPVIMALAADLRVPITFASDAHAVDQIAYAFPQLATYAASFGYGTSCVFKGADRLELEF